MKHSATILTNTGFLARMSARKRAAPYFADKGLTKSARNTKATSTPARGHTLKSYPQNGHDFTTKIGNYSEIARGGLNYRPGRRLPQHRLAGPEIDGRAVVHIFAVDDGPQFPRREFGIAVS